MDVVGTSDWVAVPAKLGVVGARSNFAQSEALKKYVAGVHGARPVAAMIEIDHYGVSSYKGRVRAVCAPQSTLNDKSVAEAVADPSHKWMDLGKLRTGEWLIASFRENDFKDFWALEDDDVPQIALQIEITERPVTALDASTVFRYKFNLLASTKRVVFS